MDLAEVRARVGTTRPRVAAELDRPNAAERLLAGVVTDLAVADRLDLLAAALDVPGRFERMLLWGADVRTGTEDLALAGALHAVLPGAGRAALLDAEPDLVVITSEYTATVDTTVDRPGHVAARAQRGEPLPEPAVAGVTVALDRHALRPVDPGLVRRAYAVARAAAVALEVAATAHRAPAAYALADRAHDLLHPGRDPLAAWSAAAEALAPALPQVRLRAVSWRHVADGLSRHPAATLAVRRIAEFPPIGTGRPSLA